MQVDQRIAPYFSNNDSVWPILICLLGSFQLLKGGQPVALRGGGKAEALLCYLGLRYQERVPRDAILSALWPAGDPALAGQSLNSLIYSLNKLLGGAPPVLHADGCYRLNAEAGVQVDLACFEALVREGDRRQRANDLAGAAEAYRSAARLYRGDLWACPDAQVIVERERLRADHLTLLARLAEYHYAQSDYATCLDYARRLLAGDSCREDAHRLIMRCCVRSGERAQALRQYRLCADILRAEFDTDPEATTTALYEQVRLDPSSI